MCCTARVGRRYVGGDIFRKDLHFTLPNAPEKHAVSNHKEDIQSKNEKGPNPPTTK